MKAAAKEPTGTSVKMPVGGGRRVRRSPELSLEQEDGHLGARDGGVGTVVVAAAAGRDAFGGELFDPVGEGRGAGNVGEDARCRSAGA